MSQGIANLAAGLSGGFPVGGSFSRSAVTRMAGGRTRWSGAVAGAAVLLFLPVAGVIAPLPRAVLGAIVIAAVLPMLRIVPIVRLFAYSKPQAVVAWTTVLATLFLAPRIERGVLVGIAVGVFVHLWRELHVEVRARFDRGTLYLEPLGVLFFASAPRLGAALNAELAEHPETERLVLDLHQLGRIDYTGALALKSVADDARSAGLVVEFIGIPPQTRAVLERVVRSHLESGRDEKGTGASDEQ